MFLSNPDWTDFGRKSIDLPIKQGLLYRKILHLMGRSQTFQKMKLAFVVVTRKGIFLFDTKKIEGEQTKSYILSTEEDFQEIRDLSVPSEQKFVIEVQTRLNHYQFQCHNFAEKDSWKKAFEHMKKNAITAIPGKPDYQSAKKESTLLHAIVNVNLLEAKGLNSAIGSTVNSFCKVAVGQTVAASTVKSGNTPSWKESFSFEVTELPTEMLLIMYDQNVQNGNDIIGYVPYIVQSAGERADTNAEWFDLRPAKLYEKPQGKVQLSIQCRFDVETQKRVTFGVHLNDLMSRDNHKDLIVPDIVYKCVKTLDRRATKVKGIFRVPGSREKMDNYEKSFDMNGMEVDFSEKDDVHLVASMLKLFLRCLPEPVIPYSAFNELIKAASNSGGPDRAKNIKHIINKRLPEVNLRTLKVVCCLLKKITLNTETTLMKVSNIAIVFSAVLLSAPPESKETKTDLLQQLPTLNAIVECLISEYNFIFNLKKRADPIADMCKRENQLSRPEEVFPDDSDDDENPQGDNSSAELPTKEEEEDQNGEAAHNKINWAAIARIAHEKIARDKKEVPSPKS